MARGPGYTLFLTPTEVVFSLSRPLKADPDVPVETLRAVHSDQPSSRLESSVLRIQLIDANPRPRVAGRDELPGKVHYFVGSDSTKWRTNVPTFGRVHYTNVYPGIDQVFYGNQRQLEYDFVVQPGADPRRIVLQFQGAGAVDLDAAGELVLRTPGGAIRQHKPQIYQDIDGRRQTISGGYARRGPSTVGFDLGAYDASRPLVIDPTLAYSTYLGGSGLDVARGIAVDILGDAYVTGFTNSRGAHFPCGSQSPRCRRPRRCRGRVARASHRRCVAVRMPAGWPRPARTASAA